MNKEQLREILNELKENLDIPANVKIEMRPMKTKAASISLKKNTIRINKNIIPTLNPDCIKYLILHELTHYRLRSTYHNDDFHKQINKRVDNAKAKELERKILTSLLELNDIL